ncbi:stage V sporulation protein AA [Paenibacillus sp.]|uniref:stage V sporulation protein AA n=1 Tax=Paenibacillus sp. TaxID=58172 RepID=UPI002D5BAB53|nr:stage V sporulation protein AA [Paenibacillus sp.]HZG55421.1 stage V sporulation protein AA [Paenibacillus sp.]
MKPIVYVRLRRRVRLPRGNAIRMKDVAQLLTEPELEPVLLELVLHRPDRGDGNLVLIDMLRVIAAIRTVAPEAEVEAIGDPHALVEVVSNERRPANWIGFAIVWLLLFFGSGLAIMNFHEDVSMPAVHRRIVYLLTGETVDHPYLLQIPYSFGIGLGMVIFFNHVFKKKINEEPSPLDVEMFKYEESVHQYVVTEEYRKLDAARRSERPPEDGKRDGAGGVRKGRKR